VALARPWHDWQETLGSFQVDAKVSVAASKRFSKPVVWHEMHMVLAVW